MNLPAKLSAIALAALCAGTPAWAQTAAPAPADVGTKAEARVVSRDELRACMNSESALTTRREQARALNAARQEENQAIRAEAAQLADDRKAIRDDEYTKLERFDRRVKLHNARIQTANTAMAGVRAEMDAVNKDLTAYNAQCGGIRFMPEDKAAILKEREGKAN